MKLCFYTPAYGPAEGFGGATFGFAGAENECLKTMMAFPDELEGTVLCGTYEACLEQATEGPWQAGIVLLGNAGGENTFVRALAEKVQAPLVGGSGAIHPETGESALVTGRGEAAVFLIRDDRFEISVQSENIHREILGEHAIGFSSPRVIETIDGYEALQWFRKQQEAYGLSPSDFEHITFSDAYGINAHLSEKDGKLVSGRDLSERMFLRRLAKEEAQSRMQAFYADEQAIVFGCAGLKSTLSTGLVTKGLGLFMFGEVCTVNERSDFGNLMLSKLIVRKK